jgi:PAS domain S-box-containing protein
VRSISSRKSAAELLKRLWSLVPSGGSLPENVWRVRRRFLVGLTWFHAIAIVLAGPVLGHSWELSVAALLRHETVLHTAAEGLVVALLAALAGWPRAGRTFQATAVGFGLMSSSAILVHLSGGYIEAHFHFFVMLAFLALCQDWIPYLLAVTFVAVHHGVVGVLWPQEVYNHPAAYNAPWAWAGIHAAFVLASCVGSVIAWRFNERAFAQTSQILEAAGEGIFGLDMEGRISFINPAAAAMLGADSRTVTGLPVTAILRHLRADGTPLPEDDCPIFAPLRDGRACRATEQIFARIDGGYVPVDYVSTPMIERGQLTGVVVSFQDITERQRSAAALQRSHRQLEETLAELKAAQQHMLQQERLRAVGQMASGIAHDFNNSLSPIVGFSELLLRRADPSGPEADAYVRLINTAAKDAAAVVRRLRDLYRERDGDKGASGELHLVRCIEEAVSLTQPRWRSEALARGVSIEVKTELPETLPPMTGDDAEIREALTNLIFNAVDAMPQGGPITIRAAAEGDAVRVDVIDSGMGMSDEVRQRCLEPFFSTKGKQGTGLGLSLVHGMIQRHRGSLTLHSRVGEGTTVTILLPVRAGSSIAAEPDSHATAAPRRLRILVVEDEPVVRKVITAQLIAEGHTVDSAVNGVEGLEKLLSGWFDVIITDRAMPEMGGDQLAKAAARLAPEKPIIMLTGFGDLMDAKGEKPEGVSVLVSKPITGDALQRAIAEATADRGSGR